jgi:hypothetical protein
MEDWQSLIRARAASLEWLDDAFVVMGDAETLPDVRLADDARPTVEALRRVGTQSLVGTPSQNVLDADVRVSLETTAFSVAWPALHDAILPQIARRLNVNWALTAQPHKLLLYEPGAFFKAHRDAEHRPAHVLSLVVVLDADADGGCVSLAHSGRTAVWPSQRVGAWACWFASVLHEVTQVTRGHRIVLTFDVLATPPPASLPTTLFPPALPHNGAPPFARLVWEEIADLLPLASRSRLAQTCRGLRAIVGTRLLASALRELANVELLQEQCMASLGFAARHSYLFEADDDSNVVPLWKLKGRDRVIAEAALRCGWNVRARRAVLLTEAQLLDRRDERNTYSRRIRIGAVLLPENDYTSLLRLQYASDDDDDDDEDGSNSPAEVSARIAQAEWVSKVSKMKTLLTAIRETDTDNESQRCLLTVPFVGVEWCETFETAARVARSTLIDEMNGLWGNESMFNMRAYAAAAIVIDVLNPADAPELLPSRDLRPVRRT